LEGFREYFENPQFRSDGLKIYPTLVIRGTGLYELWQKGAYKNYTPEELVDVIAQIMALGAYLVNFHLLQSRLLCRYHIIFLFLIFVAKVTICTHSSHCICSEIVFSIILILEFESSWLLTNSFYFSFIYSVFTTKNFDSSRYYCSLH
jgi:hypothetical protein